MSVIPPVTLWFTGLSASGKSTLAYGLKAELVKSGTMCCILDGDLIRKGLSRDLGFSAKDRAENIRRVAEAAKLLNNSGVVVIAALISPLRADRESASNIIGGDKFFEVFIDADLNVCEERDPKGLYEKARKGLIPDFTGISSPYEPPFNPSLVVQSGSESIDKSLVSLIDHCQSITF